MLSHFFPTYFDKNRRKKTNYGGFIRVKKQNIKIVCWDGDPQASRSESLKVPSSSSTAAVGASVFVVKSFQGLDGQLKGLLEVDVGDALEVVLSSSEDVSFGAALAEGGAVAEGATVVGGSASARLTSTLLMFLRGDQPGGRRRPMSPGRCMDERFDVLALHTRDLVFQGLSSVALQIEQVVQ